MWTIIASSSLRASAFIAGRPIGFVETRLSRSSNLISACHGSKQMSASSESNVSIPAVHQKSYHLTGRSTSPVLPPSSSDMNSVKKEKTSRRRMCKPGVSMTTMKSQHTIQTDIPKAMGGENQAPQPVELLLASFIGCTQATAIFVARQMGLSILRMDFDLKARRDERGAIALPIRDAPPVQSRLQEITGRVILTTDEPLSLEDLNILQEQTELRCPVANMMIASGCRMNVEWIHCSAV